MQRYLLNVCKQQNLFSDCINRNSLESTNLLCYYFIDIDECLDPSTHSCDSNANCTNTNGSYQCKCNQGYHGNGNTCTGIYVINFRHSSCFFGVIHSRNMNKVENREQTFKTRFRSLSCLLLQTLTNALRDPHTCDGNANCTNTDGSFKCQCKIGFSGDGKTCRGIY